METWKRYLVYMTMQLPKQLPFQFLKGKQGLLIWCERKIDWSSILMFQMHLITKMSQHFKKTSTLMYIIKKLFSELFFFFLILKHFLYKVTKNYKLQKMGMLPTTLTFSPNYVLSDQKLPNKGRKKLGVIVPGGYWMFPSEVKFNLFEWRILNVIFKKHLF